MDIRCFCGRKVGTAERSDPRTLVVDVADTAGEGDPITRRFKGGSRRRPGDQFLKPPWARPALNPRIVVSANDALTLRLSCPRHGEVTASGAELDRGLRHGQTVHHLTRPTS